MAAAKSSSGLIVRDVEVAYGGIEVVHGVSVDVDKGEVVGLVAHNGAGKTTLLKAIAGILEFRGAMWWDGVDIQGRPSWDRVDLGISYVSDRDSTFSSLTVEQNLRVAAALAGGDRSRCRPEEMILQSGFTSLTSVLPERAGHLSGGFRRMLSLAMVLPRHPGLLLLDEPFASLAPSSVQLIQGKISELATESGITIVVVDHRLETVWQVADRVVVMRLGELTETLDTASSSAAEVLRFF